MSLARPEFLWWLLLLPAVWLVGLLAHQRGREALHRFFGPGESGPGARSIRPVFLLHWSFCLAVALLVLALAGPRWGEQEVEVPAAGIDLMVVLDQSRSMRVRDVRPSRLERARRELLDLAERFQAGRLGLVTFGGAGQLVCPLTRDHPGFARFVQDVDPLFRQGGGTDIASGVKVALEAFDPDSNARRVMLVLSDGENLEEESELGGAAWSAYSEGVEVHTVLVGTAEGGPVPLGEGRQDAFVVDRRGLRVRSRADAGPLAELAARTGGLFVAVGAEPFPIERIVRERLSDLRVSDAGSALRRVPRERFQLFLLAGLLLLLLGRLRRGLPGSRRAAVIGPPLLLLVVGFAPQAVDLAEAVRLFDAGRVEEARQRFELAARQQPRSAKIAFDLAAAEYRLREYARAAQGFERCRSLATGPLRAKAAFGAGVAWARQAAVRASGTGARQGDLDLAIDMMRRSRRSLVDALLEGYGRPAAVDLELVSRRLDELERRRQRDRSGKRAGEDGALDQDAEPAAGEDGDAVGEPEQGAEDSDADRNPRDSEGASAAGGDPDPAAEGAVSGVPDAGSTLPGGMFREEAGNLEDIVRRYERERRAHDLKRARASRSGAERDW